VLTRKHEHVLHDNSPVGKGGTKRKRGNYNNYSPEVRAKMARYAVENGVQNATRNFTKEFGSPVYESKITMGRISIKPSGIYKTKRH